MKIVEPSVDLLWHTPQPARQIEISGRRCYKSEDKITPDSAQEFCRRMVKSGHHAMIEHASASFRIITDRGVSHEIVRHRLASYAQESTRFCDYSKGKFNNECSFIEPPDLMKDQKIIWVKTCELCERAYFSMLEGGCPPQIARSVLPNSLKTEIIMTANFREWRHFIKLRGSGAAHPQIRPIAWAVKTELTIIAHSIFGDLR